MSDEHIPAKKRGRPRKEAATEDTPAVVAGPPKIGAVIPRTEEGTWSADDVLAKRLAGQPFGIKADAIPMAEPGRWQLYIAHSGADEGRHYDMVFRKGWVPVTAADLAPGIVPESLGLHINEAGALCRGARGDEIVYKMPKGTYNALQKQKAAKNVEGMGSQAKSRMAVAEAASAQLGDEAAEFLSKHATVTIEDSQRTTA